MLKKSISLSLSSHVAWIVERSPHIQIILVRQDGVAGHAAEGQRRGPRDPGGGLGRIQEGSPGHSRHQIEVNSLTV